LTSYLLSQIPNVAATLARTPVGYIIVTSINNERLQVLVDPNGNALQKLIAKA